MPSVLVTAREGYYALVGALITHYTHRLEGKNGACLPHFVVETVLLEARDKNMVYFLENGHLFGVMSPSMRMPRPGPGKG